MGFIEPEKASQDCLMEECCFSLRVWNLSRGRHDAATIRPVSHAFASRLAETVRPPLSRKRAAVSNCFGRADSPSAKVSSDGELAGFE
jgi:hypothetical protein